MRVKVAIFFGLLVYHAFIRGFLEMNFPSLDVTLRVLSFVADLVMILFGLIVLFSKETHYKRILFILFLILSSITILLTLDRIDLGTQMNGLREKLFFLCSLLVVENILRSNAKEGFTRLFTVFLVVFGISQVPVAYSQFLAFGAGDMVGGTLAPGNSGNLTMLIFLSTFYLIVQYAGTEDGSDFHIMRAFLFLLLLIPCTINETKISFLYLAVFLVLLLPSLNKSYKAIPLVLLGIVFLFLLNSIYSQVAQDTHQIVTRNFLERYLFGEDYGPRADVPRFTKLRLMFELMAKDPMMLIFGAGYGLFIGGPLMGAPAFARTYWHLVSGSKILLFSLWFEGGAAAVLVFGLMSFPSLGKGAVLPANVRRFQLFLSVVFLSMWLYNSAIFNRVFAMISAYFVAWIEGSVIDSTHENTSRPSEM